MHPLLSPIILGEGRGRERKRSVSSGIEAGMSLAGSVASLGDSPVSTRVA